MDRFRKHLNSFSATPPTLAADLCCTCEGLHPLLASTLYINCGLCAIPALKEMGVHALKIPVRGTPWQKRRYVRAVRAVSDHPNPTPEFCKRLINSPEFCARPGSCYYDLRSMER